MNSELQQSVLSVAERPVSVLIASTGTATAGASTYYQLLPEILGAVASGVGILVSLGLFFLAWRKDCRERKKSKLELQILKNRELDRQREASNRESAGQPVRRSDDQG